MWVERGKGLFSTGMVARRRRARKSAENKIQVEKSGLRY